LNFCPSLTVVYGDNAAGKSGYTRILKSACRARGDEDILGNVLSGNTPLNPSVSIKYTVGNDSDIQEWSGSEDDDNLSRVSVFDAHSATVYLTSRTDVAFRPFGLDLFDKLSQACLAVRSKLERDKTSLNISPIQSLQLPEETSAAKFLANISSLTSPEKAQSLGMLSDEEKERLKLLEKQLLDLQANDPAKTAKELSLREGRYKTLLTHIKKLDESLSSTVVDKIFIAREDVKSKGDTAIKLRKTTFQEGLLNGTGSDAWTTMWETAKQFSINNAYPDTDFPYTEDAARCLLCQQDLKPDAITRLKQFETFVKSIAEAELKIAKDKYLRLLHDLEEFKITNDATNAAIKEIHIDDEEMADAVNNTLTNAEIRRSKIVDSLRKLQILPSDLPDYASISDTIQKLIEQTKLRVQGLQKQADPSQKEKISNEVTELKARETLGKNEQHVLAEIERKKNWLPMVYVVTTPIPRLLQQKARP